MTACHPLRLHCHFISKNCLERHTGPPSLHLNELKGLHVQTLGWASMHFTERPYKSPGSQWLHHPAYHCFPHEQLTSMTRDLSQSNSGDHKHRSRCSRVFPWGLRQRHHGALWKRHAERESESVSPAAAHRPGCNSHPWHRSPADASGLPPAGQAQRPRHRSRLRGRHKHSGFWPLGNGGGTGRSAWVPPPTSQGQEAGLGAEPQHVRPGS